MIELPDPIRLPLLELIRQHAAAWDILAFGSRVTGSGHEGSDLDIALRHPSHPTKRLETLALLRAALRESDIPIRIDLHDWADLTPSFQEEINRHHVKL